MERPDFIEQLLQESEAAEASTRIEMDKLQADHMLSAVAVVDDQMAEVNDLVDREIKILEEYRSNELSRLDQKRSWLVFNLEGFMRSSGEKTTRLPHGILKLRKGRDRVAVIAPEQFLEVGTKLHLVRTVPEQISPDIQAILQYVKSTGSELPGIEYIPAEVRFTYTTNGDKNAERERSKESEGRTQPE